MYATFFDEVQAESNPIAITAIKLVVTFFIISLKIKKISFFYGIVIFLAIVAVCIHTIVTIVPVFSVVTIASIFAVNAIAVVVAVLAARHVNSIDGNARIREFALICQLVEQAKT
jgi:FtsH-binding integral membrane protein